jgi:Fe-S-cluster-containing dehydrogenase component
VARWNLIIDVAKCENCHNCALAVKDEHCGNDFPRYAASQPPHGHHWIKIERRIRGEAPMVDVAYLPTTCNHCDDAPCVRAAPDGAVYKRDDGIVIIDPEKAKGRKEIVDSCPYGAIWWNEESQLPQKWIFDAHLLDHGWKEPRCVQVCPTGALQSAKLEDAAMLERVERESLEVLQPELGARPRVYYRNLYRYTKCFLGGTVIAEVKGSIECIDGARVTLIKEGRALASISSDLFGDFKFDRLEPRSGRYRLEAAHPELGTAAIEVDLEESRYVGNLQLRN